MIRPDKERMQIYLDSMLEEMFYSGGLGTSTSSAEIAEEPLTSEKIMEMVRMVEDLKPLQPMPNRVIESNNLPLITKQIRFPRSKKKRILKKWSKRECNTGRFQTAFLVSGDLYIPPSFADALKKY